MTRKTHKAGRDASWWQFKGGEASAGAFVARGTESIGRLYFPLLNTSGMLSWTTPQLHGSPASSYNEFFGIPLSAEDFPHSLAHRGFWLAEAGRDPFSLSSISPSGLVDRVNGGRNGATVEAGPGWFSLSRADAQGRFLVKATIWCPADLSERVELMAIEVVNTSKKPLALHPYAGMPVYARSADNLRDHRHVTALLHRVEAVAHGLTVCPTMTFDERGHEVNHLCYSALAFGPGARKPRGVWTSQERFLGDNGTFAAPRAVWNMEDAPRPGRTDLEGKEVVAGFRFAELRLKPGQKANYLLVSGISDDRKAMARWTRWAAGPGRAATSLERTQRYWGDVVRRIHFRTGDPQLDNWMLWVNMQPVLRRYYGNSFLPQFDYGRGGRGWRDLWQDCLALLLSDPSSVRRMLHSNYGGVRIDGSNATIIGRGGTFIADRNNIPRTWMDHGCWPTYTTLLYLDQTGDLDFVLQPREYFRDPQIFRCHRRDASWTEAYGNQLRTKKGEVYRGTIFEHMLIQNLTAFFCVGEHNVCRMEGADWNDGLDMAAERGESVAFSTFYAWNLERLAALVEQLAEAGHRKVQLAEEVLILLDRLPGRKRVRYDSWRAKNAHLKLFMETVARDVTGRTVGVRAADLASDLREKSRELEARIRKQEWVKLDAKHHCFNGYYDNEGRRVEGPSRSGVRMTLTGQVFSVMSGAATEEQVDAVIRSVDRYLRDEPGGGVRLNTDFGSIQPALGRAFSFAYGEKENGAVFSHMAVMYAFALYQRRRPEAARTVWHALYRMAIDQERARIFPSLPEYFNNDGRGMYGYLTGSASWLGYLVLTQVFGVRGAAGDLVLDPQLTIEDFDAHGRASVRVPFADRDLFVTYLNPDRVAAGKYVVQQVLAGADAVPFERMENGVRISRSAVRKLDAGRQARISVVLVKK
jgi:cellobiose phosphorylase